MTGRWITSIRTQWSRMSCRGIREADNRVKAFQESVRPSRTLSCKVFWDVPLDLFDAFDRSRGCCRGGLSWESGLELSLGADCATYRNDISYLDVRGRLSSRLGTAQDLGESASLGAELLALLKKPGAKTLSALAPGVWIEKTF